ncbi:MAG: DUF1467 family protein [Alphaproteobacteria bacterium]|nr:DUF1467 family protein [Alphaproteobacteria bacterium]
MNPVSGITLFTIVWWMVFFCMLPIGMRQPDQRVPGEMPGAPAVPNLKRKALWTTCISIVIWLVIFTLVKIDVYSFRAE